MIDGLLAMFRISKELVRAPYRKISPREILQGLLPSKLERKSHSSRAPRRLSTRRDTEVI